MRSLHDPASIPAVALGDEDRCARGQVHHARFRGPDRVEQAHETGVIPQAGALEELVELDPPHHRAVERARLLDRLGQAPVEDDQPATGPDAGPRGRQRGDRIGQVVDRILEVDEVELAGPGQVLAGPALDRDPAGKARLLDVADRPRQRVRLELDADQRGLRGSAGRRRSASARRRRRRREPDHRRPGRRPGRAARPAPPGRRRRCPGRSAPRSPGGSAPAGRRSGGPTGRTRPGPRDRGC